MSPEHHKLSQEVVEFLIEHQDWFMLDIPPPPRKDSILDSNKPKPGRNGSNFSTTSPTSPTVLPSKVGILGKKDKSSKGETGSPSKNSKGPFSSLTNQSRPTEEPEDFNLYVGPLSDEEEAAEGGWRLAGAAAGGSSVGRRRTFSERGSPRPPMVDEQNSGRKSAENVGTAGMSMSAPAGGAGAILTGNPIHLTPVRETSGVDMDVLAELQEKENNAAVPAVMVTSSHQRSGTGSRSGTAGSAVEAGGTSTGTASVLGTGANVSRSSSTKDRRTKFDDSKHPRTEDEREKRGRSIISGVFGGRRSRTVEGTPATGTATTTTTTTTGGADVSRAGSRGGHDRHVLKKRNSRGDVEKI